jgi:Zn-dependent peptidase ImmA (M78 family)/DNA-binding XRE family transcriptional regulator
MDFVNCGLSLLTEKMNMLHDRLRRARILKGLSLQQVADQLGDITKQALSKYEKGKDAPNSTRLIRLAEVLGVQPEFFFRPDSVALGDVDFRKHSSLAKREQEAIKERVREHVERYLAIERCFESERLAPSFAQWSQHYVVSTSEDAERAAAKLRQDWKLGVNPIANLTEELEEHGVKVLHMEAHEKFDGLCALVNDAREAVIVSNSERPGDRQRFNLAHELGHLVMRLPEEIHNTRQEENLCHRFAGALLFPEAQVREVFGNTRSKVLFREFMLAKEEWGISMMAILRRLYDLNIVSDSYYKNTARFWSMKGWRSCEPVRLEKERSFRMEQLVCRALAEDLIAPSRAAEILDKSVAEIESILNNEEESMDVSQDSYL